MKSYQPHTPRATFAVVAVALTALTLGLGVAPALLDGADTAVTTLAQAAPAGPTSAAVQAQVFRVDVMAARQG